MEPSRRTRVPSLGSQLFGAGVIDGAASFLKSCETVPPAAHGMSMSMSEPDRCVKALPRPCSSGSAHADMDLRTANRLGRCGSIWLLTLGIE